LGLLLSPIKHLLALKTHARTLLGSQLKQEAAAVASSQQPPERLNKMQDKDPV
jgi:hypothetical protein